ncbi:hypothetical protein B9G98_04233 [Wickerhamiella sorbophila]|uniref:Phosphatidylglycerol/phosphatidylinositol transfer protein n=1 Tax=Wickerhamiella sorbophila TaxID=45607 RepID=A0A2T0FNP6_9ASCO|nr:hypothetical protein B9G98_04233 [Wickerhamiella sorbophila]PRT56613.1 hypothetical protein B9G98_04233 [Wickerhamiella sorbophila]
MRFLWLIPAVLALKGPQSIDELVAMAFKNGEAPPFVPLPGNAIISIASNDTASLKLNQLEIQPYPLKPGIVDFSFQHSLTKSIPPGSKLLLSSWTGTDKTFEGSVDLCAYLPYAQLPCPIAPYKAMTDMLQRLQVPNEVKTERVSFVGKAVTANDELIAHFAAIIDLHSSSHDEL